MKNNNLKKNFFWNIIGTTFNAFNSLFFMIIATRINGQVDAGIFSFAFATASLFNIIGVYSGRIYQVTDNDKNINDKDYIINKIITCLIMLIVTIIFISFNKYNLYKSLIIIFLCLLKMFEAFAESLYAIFQKDDNLFKVGISLTIKSILGLLVFLIVDLITKNVLFAVISILISYIIVMVIYDFHNLSKSSFKNVKTNYNNVIQIFYKGFFAFIIAFLTLYLINSSRYAIDDMMSDNYQTIFGVIIMPATVMILFTQFIIHPFLTMIKEDVLKRNYNHLISIVNKVCLSILAIGIFVVICSSIFGVPILNFIYGISLNKYLISLILVMIGSVLYALTSVFTTVLISMRYTFIQAVNYLVLSIIAFLGSKILVEMYGVNGACFSYFIIMLLSFVSFLIILMLLIRKESNKNE